MIPFTLISKDKEDRGPFVDLWGRVLRSALSVPEQRRGIPSGVWEERGVWYSLSTNWQLDRRRKKNGRETNRSRSNRAAAQLTRRESVRGFFPSFLLSPSPCETWNLTYWEKGSDADVMYFALVLIWYHPPRRHRNMLRFATHAEIPAFKMAKVDGGKKKILIWLSTRELRLLHSNMRENINWKDEK